MIKQNLCVSALYFSVTTITVSVAHTLNYMYKPIHYKNFKQELNKMSTVTGRSVKQFRFLILSEN